MQRKTILKKIVLLIVVGLYLSACEYQDEKQKVKVEDANQVYLKGIPYIHQVYDTPSNFNGHGACGAAAALMAIQFYQILPAHPITVNVPEKHNSDYGWYVSNVYTKGRKFNVYSTYKGKASAGGYGYIYQNNLEDTKGHMAEYIRYHGLESSVDWKPSWSKLKNEINKSQPFVVLSSITSSGHYMTAAGYKKNMHTALFKDPYGDKNKGYPNYNGKWAYYDWPGYNNGYSNLKTVHCFIYSRAK
jgi:hypothetical protein